MVPSRVISEPATVTLAVTQASLQALPDLLRAQSLRPSRASARRWRFVYWDTSDLRVYRARSALVLVRRGREPWLQRYYRELYNRRVLIVPDAPGVNGVPDARLVEGQCMNGELRPRAERDVMRTVRTIGLSGDGRITLSIDRGRARAVGARWRWRPVLEIELAVVAGNAEQLYELAAIIVDELPGARLLFESDAERAYRGLAGAREGPRHAGAVAVDLAGPLPRLVANATAECLAQIADNVEEARRGLDDEALHQLRVGVRRLRSIARIAPRAGLAPLPDDARARLKRLWMLLGEARDWDVFMLQTMPEVRRIVEPVRANRFEAIATALWKSSHAKVSRALHGKPFQLAMLALAASNARHCAQAGLQGKHSSRRVAQRLLSAREAQLLRRGGHVGRQSDERLHELRVRVKRLRYVAEFLAALFDREASARYLKHLSAVQTVLGRLNDLVVAERLVQVVASRCGEPAAAQGWRRHADPQERALRGELRGVWKAFRRCRAFWA